MRSVNKRLQVGSGQRNGSSSGTGGVSGMVTTIVLSMVLEYQMTRGSEIGTYILVVWNCGGGSGQDANRDAEKAAFYTSSMIRPCFAVKEVMSL